MPDLRNPRLMLLKAVLFLCIGVIAGAMIFLDAPALKTAGLLLLVIWAFARAYYFAFYVITHYIDPGFTYAGLFSAVRFWFSRKKR